MKIIMKQVKSCFEDVTYLCKSKPWLIILTIFYFFVTLSIYKYINEAYTLQDVGFIFGDYQSAKILMTAIILLNFGTFFLIKEKVDYKINLLTVVLIFTLGLPNIVLGIISIFFSRLSSEKIYFYFISIALLLLTLFDIFTRIEESIAKPTLAISIFSICLLFPYLSRTTAIKKK